MARREGRFLAPGVGYDEKSGLTFDGHAIDFRSGKLVGEPRHFSAASKESLHLALLHKALAGDATARLMISPDNPAAAPRVAREILARKIKSYHAFDAKYPGFGGFLPWFVSKDGRVTPQVHWDNRVPGLDNGQLAWAIYVVARSLREHGDVKLARAYEQHLALMAKNVVRVFFDAAHGRFRGEAHMRRGNRVAPARNRYDSGKNAYLIDDPHEGMLLYYFADLFGDWGKHAAWRDKAWDKPRRKPATYRARDGTRITVSKGHWHSSHESWGFTVLPLLDVPVARTLFNNEQVMRTRHAADRGQWLRASIHAPNRRPGQDLRYQNALGVGQRAVTEARVSREAIYAPYASFPLALVERGRHRSRKRARRVFATWLETMVGAPRMFGRYGMGESFSGAGDAIAPVLTWDGKVLPMLAWMGGTVDEVRRYLRADGKYDRFISRVKGEYRRFEGKRIEGTRLRMRAPTRRVPHGMADFARGLE